MDTVKVYRDTASEWRWRRVSENGRIVSESGEGYDKRDTCLDMAIYLNGEDIVYKVDDEDGSS